MDLASFDVQKPEDHYGTIDECLTQISDWAVQCREGPLKLTIHAALTETFVAWDRHLSQLVAQGQDITLKAVELLGRVKKASLAWKDPGLGPMTDRLSVHSENHHKMQKLESFISSCDIFLQADADPQNTHAQLQIIGAEIPSVDSRQIIVVTDEERQKIAWQAMHQATSMIWSSPDLHTMLDIIAIVVKFKACVEIRLSSTNTGFRQQVQQTHAIIASGEQILNLHNALDLLINQEQALLPAPRQ